MSPRTMDGFEERVAPHELPELMDGECSYEDYRACLVSLEQVNRWLLGYRPTLAWLERMPLRERGLVHVVDVGCGGGGLLRRIAAWAKSRSVAVRLTGIDLNPFAIRAAREFTAPQSGIIWTVGDALGCKPDISIDVIVSSLMTHHLEEEQIVALLRWMDGTAQVGWFINDLERSRRSSHAFALLAKAAHWHRFVQHDGPVSFRRALRAGDWERLLASAGIRRSAVEVESWWPGRLCVGSTPPC